jgi:glycosyltransferase involved in cell wall biosynthesis
MLIRCDQREHGVKVVHLHFGKDGGQERFFVNLVGALHARGVEQRIFIRPRRIWRQSIAHVGPIYEGCFHRISLSRFFLAARVRRVLREFHPNAILAWAKRANHLMPAYPEAIRVGRLGDFPLTLEYLRNTDVLVGNVPGIIQRARELGWEGATAVISNFTEARPSVPKDRLALQTPPDAFVVAAAGRFVPRKGFDTLIDAIAQVDGAYLWLIGEGKDERKLQTRVRQLGIADRVRFIAWQKDIVPFVAAADLFVMPSRHEPLGNVILEAWGIGTPVVASRSEGPAWMMNDGMDGLLVDIGDTAGFAGAIRRLRADPALRQRLAAGGRETLARQFSADAITDAYLQLLSSPPPARD